MGWDGHYLEAWEEAGQGVECWERDRRPGRRRSSDSCSLPKLIVVPYDQLISRLTASSALPDLQSLQLILQHWNKKSAEEENFTYCILYKVYKVTINMYTSILHVKFSTL